MREKYVFCLVKVVLIADFGTLLATTVFRKRAHQLMNCMQLVPKGFSFTPLKSWFKLDYTLTNIKSNS